MGRRAFDVRAAALLALITPAVAWAGLSYTLEPKTVEPGQRARLEIRLPITDVGLKATDDEVELPVLHDDLLTDAKHLQLLERDFRREKDMLIWSYELTAYGRGKHLVPPVEIRHGASTFSTEAASLEVNATRDPNDKAMREDFGPAKFPVPWSSLLAVAGLVVLALLAYLLLRRKLAIFLLRRRERLAAALAPAAVVEPPESWLRRELTRLKAEIRDAAGDETKLRGVVDQFSRIVRRYFAKLSGAPAEALTTREFEQSFTGQKPAEAIVPTFEKCDDWRFSGATAETAESVASRAVDEGERALIK